MDNNVYKIGSDFGHSGTILELALKIGHDDITKWIKRKTEQQ